MQNRREIDIALSIVSALDESKAVFLIENKLDTAPQPNQAESYRAECQALIREARASFTASVLVCPHAYVQSHAAFAKAFDTVIHYEDVQRFLSNRSTSLTSPELVARLRLRARLIGQAINKSRRGYRPVLVSRIGTFNSAYVQLMKTLADGIVPGPSMTRAGNPAESVSLIFDHSASFAELPESIRPSRFAHETGRGKTHRANYIAVLFKGWGRYLESHQVMLQRSLAGTPYRLTAEQMTAKRPNPALRLYVDTPPIDNQADFDSQLEEIEKGVRAAAGLRRWLIENRAVLERWKAVFSECDPGLVH